MQYVNFLKKLPMLIYKTLQNPMFFLALSSTLAIQAHAQNTPEAANSLKEVQVVNTSQLPGLGQP